MDAATSRDTPILPSGAPMPLRYCKECGRPFYPTRRDQDYCTSKCRQTLHKRRYERGAKLYDFAMEWRGKRVRGGFTELCRIIDDWLRDERDRRKAHAEIRAAYKKGGKP